MALTTPWADSLFAGERDRRVLADRDVVDVGLGDVGRDLQGVEGGDGDEADSMLLESVLAVEDDSPTVPLTATTVPATGARSTVSATAVGPRRPELGRSRSARSPIRPVPVCRLCVDGRAGLLRGELPPRGGEVAAGGSTCWSSFRRVLCCCCLAEASAASPGRARSGHSRSSWGPGGSQPGLAELPLRSHHGVACGVDVGSLLLGVEAPAVLGLVE